MSGRSDEWKQRWTDGDTLRARDLVVVDLEEVTDEPDYTQFSIDPRGRWTMAQIRARLPLIVEDAAQQGFAVTLEQYHDDPRLTLRLTRVRHVDIWPMD